MQISGSAKKHSCVLITFNYEKVADGLLLSPIHLEQIPKPALMIKVKKLKI